MRATITCAQLESRLLARRNKNIAVISRILLWLVNMNRLIIQRITALLMLPDSRELFFSFRNGVGIVVKPVFLQLIKSSGYSSRES